MDTKKDEFIKAANKYIDSYLEAKRDVNTIPMAIFTFMWAARNNNIDLINRLIDAGINVNIIDSLGNTALIYCCKQGYKLSIFNRLLDAGADVNIKNLQGESALDYAYQTGNKEFINLLLSKGAVKSTDSFNALIQAITIGDLNTVTKLLQSVDNINRRFDKPTKYVNEKPKTLLTVAVQNKHVQIAEELLKAGATILIPDSDNFGNWPVISGKEFGWLFSNCPSVKPYIEKHAQKEHFLIKMAVQSGNKDLVEILQKYGAVITNDELNVAISQGNKELVNNLLSSGKLRGSLKGSLESACKCNDFNLVKTLIESGASLNHRDVWGDRMDTTLDWGPSPLMIACKKGNFDIVKLLINSGAEVNIPPRKLSKENPREYGYYCDSPLMIAVRYRHIPIITLLLNSGADVKYKSERDETALSLAQKNGYTEIVELLKSYGAK